jgi:hypothetical protein
MCRHSFGGYAVEQIRKARGLNKKISNPMNPERKGVLDFCYVIDEGKSVPILFLLEEYKFKQEYCGLVSLDHMKYMYIVLIQIFNTLESSSVSITVNNKKNAIILEEGANSLLKNVDDLNIASTDATVGHSNEKETVAAGDNLHLNCFLNDDDFLITDKVDGFEENISSWRVHFHVPLFLENYGALSSTQSDIVDTINVHKKVPFTNHLEIETYTWGVLPTEFQAPLNESIIREINWVKGLL